MHPPVIRPASTDDASAIAQLLPDLGYPASAEEVRARLVAIAGLPRCIVAVAELGGEVVAVLHAACLISIARGNAAELVALVVRADLQGRGLGQACVRWATVWAREQGETRLRLRSGAEREAAHRFYRKLGFAQTRTSETFELMLDVNDGVRSNG